jgi:hypothetical protein
MTAQSNAHLVILVSTPPIRQQFSFWETSRLIGAHWYRFREQNGRLGRPFCSLNLHNTTWRNSQSHNEKIEVLGAERAQNLYFFVVTCQVVSIMRIAGFEGVSFYF